MRWLVIGSVLAALLAMALVTTTAQGRSTVHGLTQRWQRQAALLYHEGWVAAAWPVENGLRLTSHQGALLQIPIRPVTSTSSKSARTSAGNGPIGWDAWLRPGVEARWRLLQAPTHHAAQVRQLVTLELWIVPFIVLVLLAKPLWTLTARLGRLRPGTGHGTAQLAGVRELRQLRPRRSETGLRLGQVGRRTVALPEAEVYEHVLVCGPPGSGKSSGLILPNILAERGTRSLVIVDPKSELLSITRGAVERHSEVWVVNWLRQVPAHA